jgi:hypothetical protein
MLLKVGCMSNQIIESIVGQHKDYEEFQSEFHKKDDLFIVRVCNSIDNHSDCRPIIIPASYHSKVSSKGRSVPDELDKQPDIWADYNHKSGEGRLSCHNN